RLAGTVNPTAGDGARGDGAPHAPIVVSCVRALMQPTISPEHFARARHTIRRDGRYPLMALMTRWQQIGYEPATLVEQPGQFSRRGGIVDVWSPASDMPVRIEFYGDEIDSIRKFD